MRPKGCCTETMIIQADAIDLQKIRPKTAY